MFKSVLDMDLREKTSNMQKKGKDLDQDQEINEKLISIVHYFIQKSNSMKIISPTGCLL